MFVGNAIAVFLFISNIDLLKATRETNPTCSKYGVKKVL